MGQGAMNPMRQNRTNLRHMRRSERGAILPIVTLLLPALLGMMALSIDIGYLYFVKRRMQTAADAGAVAASYEIKRNSSQSALVAAGERDAALNGFDESHGEFVTVNHPPASGSRSGNSNFAEVVITWKVPTFFMRVINQDAVQVQARAVAGTVADPGPACIYVLDPTAQGAFSGSGSISVNAQCGIVVNSNHSRAMTLSGSGCVNSTLINITGNFSVSGSVCYSPTPNTGVPPTPDPLAALQPPSVGACNFTNRSISGSTVTTVTPGVYCNGISISGSSNVTFQPGTYILRGGGLKISGSSTINGQGVAFYNTSGGSYSYSSISISGSSTVCFKAPASGALAGVLFFQDRAAPTGTSNSISGSSGTTYEGAIYFPTQPLTYSGSSTQYLSPWTIVIARTLTFSGSTNFDDNYFGGYSQPPITRVALAE